MPDLMPLALEFARAFNKAVRTFRMYSPTHPQVAHDLAGAFAWIEKMTSQESPVALGTRDGVMIVQGHPVRELTPILKSFCDLISSRGISSFSAQHGATLAEFSALVDILVRKPDEVLQGDRIKPELLKPLQKFRINELRFVALQDGASEEAVQLLSSSGAQQQDVMQLLSAFVTAGKGDSAVLSQRLASLIRKGDAADLVRMLDDVVGEMDEAGVLPEERIDRMSTVFRSLPIAEEVQKLRRILVMQEDPPMRAEWMSALKQSGFDPDSADSPPAAIQKLRDGSHWSGFVADAGFRGADGVKFLDDVAKSGKRPVPVVLLSWDEAVREAPSVANYPGLRFISQPTNAPMITGAMDEIALPPEVERLTEEQIAADPTLAAEVERARVIQSKLLPTDIPAVDGFEISAQYLPAQRVGGDYYDVLQLPGGRLGFIIADVSGKGISAAMIMVMARTIFHAVAPGAVSPKEAVMQANSKLVPDLPPGVFLTLAYAVLDPASSSVTVVSCGHNPPLLWTEFGGMGIVETVAVQGAAMGLVRGPAFERSLRETVVTLSPGEHLLFHTDGVNEAMDMGDEEFGDKRLIKAMVRAGERNAQDMTHGVVNAVMKHRGAAPASDDLTVLVVRKQPGGGAA
ncbi:MAG: stage II sporulation E family [Planctomycetota bacterium]|nr:MAG: stage II sporulation E family [Planctomycetota bacterium]